ncbi:L,D-transpeptidase [Dictyobacter kobayashii]|uniref:L,D-TPase catalytic domain-containing protein n=1 Tax=Dictyobacter kobayashii TaxID=2014872 RepID=A0A402APT8_9CHLR|nr:L,D-transpeptidase [Dictyobacter kobayashii]GCE21188.1 hypothetical protein KDK_49880 [Dictyobacter kobayashii]
MHTTRSTSTSSMRRVRLPYLLCALTFCLLLSGCQVPGFGGNASTNSNTTQVPTPTPTPEISASLKNQGNMELQTLQQWISTLKQYGGQADSYQQQYTSDQQALQNAHSADTYQAALNTTRDHVNTIKMPAIKQEQQSLQQQLQQQASDWENTHPHLDTFNNKTYKMGFEYDDQTGIGTWIKDDLSTAKTFADYQQIVENTNMFMINLKAMMENANDKTPYNQPHQADLKLLQTYNKTDKLVMVVSLSEQTMRIYDHSKLIKTLLVTTGQPEKPTPPGSWWVESHQTHITFKSIAPKGDPYWYPDTPINFAMQYHSDGYFIHDSWWRAEYGPNTQFPHQDVTGDSGADVGSHGCVNLSKSDAQWVYDHVQLFTGIIIY